MTSDNFLVPTSIFEKFFVEMKKLKVHYGAIIFPIFIFFWEVILKVKNVRVM